MNKLRGLLPLYFVIFFGFVGFSLMITIFTPMMLSVQSGMLPTDISVSSRVFILGVLLALYPLGQFLGSPVLGEFSDHYGRRKILILSLLATTIFYFFIAWALMIKSLWLLMLASFLAGLSEANVAIAQGAIADVTDDSNRNRLFGYIYMSGSSAYIFGPLVGGKLADPNLLSWFNYATPFWLVFILLTLVLLWVMITFKETEEHVVQGKIDYFSALTSLVSIVTAKHLRYLYFLDFLFYISIYGFLRCYPMYLVDGFHLSVSASSVFIAWVAVPIILGNLWLTGYLTSRIGVQQLTALSALLTGVFMIIVVIPPGVNALWITLFITSLALAVCLPSSATLLSIAANKDEQGRVMGNNQSLQALSQAVSGVIGGVLAMITVKLSLIILGFFAIAGAALLYFWSART
jgi:DHA1 family tetracycline resistance protein-like MFS transporter